MRHMLDKLAADYLLAELEKHIDHGLEEPRDGGHAIVRDLQEDLLKEQKAVLKSQTVDTMKQAASPDELASLEARLFATGDLYQEIADANDCVAVDRSNIYKTEGPIIDVLGDEKTEHFYLTKVRYNIHVPAFMVERGMDPMLAEELAKLATSQRQRFAGYIESYGARELLEKWLPGTPSAPGYEFEWELTGLSFQAPAMIQADIELSERWLTEGVNA